YNLYMQLDCNLVLYYKKIVIWDTKTNNKGERCFLRLQKDGNLVIYDMNDSIIWSYNIYHKNVWVSYALCVENTGYAVVYNTI
ncbi:hypothetical protein SELMODRAFT_19085, partial [Selaginella moellendorffii]